MTTDEMSRRTAPSLSGGSSSVACSSRSSGSSARSADATPISRRSSGTIRESTSAPTGRRRTRLSCGMGRGWRASARRTTRRSGSSARSTSGSATRTAPPTLRRHGPTTVRGSTRSRRTTCQRSSRSRARCSSGGRWGSWPHRRSPVVSRKAWKWWGLFTARSCRPRPARPPVGSVKAASGCVRVLRPPRREKRLVDPATSGVRGLAFRHAGRAAEPARRSWAWPDSPAPADP